MAAKLGPKIVNDGLVLCLDAADANSYAGEPVTNLVTSSAVDFSVRSTYTGNTFSQVVDNESPSGYACEMSYTGTVNSSARSRFGEATNIPTSGTGFVSIWAKKSAGPSTTMRPKVYTGTNWYVLEPLDGGSVYFTNEYRPFGAVVTFGTNSGGPNPGFSMTHGGNSTENDKTRWIKPQVTTLSYNTPFANLTRSVTNGWVDLSGNSNSGTLTNMVGTGVSHYRDGQVIMPINNAYLDFDGNDDYVTLGQSLNNVGSTASIEVWFKSEESIGSSQYTIMFGWGDGTSYYSNFSIGNWFGAWSDESIHLGINSASVILAERSGHSKYHDGNWHHAVATIGANNYAIYVDGSAVTTSFYSGTQSTSFTNIFNFSAGTYSTIGSRPYTIATGGSGTFNGKIPLVRVYDKILTAAEVLSNYNATKGRFS